MLREAQCGRCDEGLMPCLDLGHNSAFDFHVRGNFTIGEPYFVRFSGRHKRDNTFAGVEKIGNDQRVTVVLQCRSRLVRDDGGVCFQLRKSDKIK